MSFTPSLPESSPDDTLRTPELLPRFRIAPTDFLLLSALIAVALLFAYIYTRSERFFYFWDYYGYQDKAVQTVNAFRQSVVEGMRHIAVTFRQDYNHLFALPFVPLGPTVGLSRRIYIVATTFVYLVPYTLAMGAVATQLLTTLPTRRVFWSVAFLSLLIPPVWFATLRGYPDIGAAALLGFGLSLYLRD